MLATIPSRRFVSVVAPSDRLKVLMLTRMLLNCLTKHEEGMG